MSNATQTFDSLEMINGVKDIIIEWANNEGISLSEYFESVKEFKEFVMGFTIKLLVTECGVSKNDALEMVFGKENVDRLVQDVYHKLRNK